jgi:hypothetical protein
MRLNKILFRIGRKFGIASRTYECRKNVRIGEGVVLETEKTRFSLVMNDNLN